MGENSFVWGLHPGAEALVDGLVAEALARSPRLRRLAGRLADETSTRLHDWVDHVGAPIAEADAAAAGYVHGYGTAAGVWRHPGAQLPALVPGRGYVLAVRVDDVTAFGAASGEAAQYAGSPGSGLRRVIVGADDGAVLAGVERRSWGCGVVPEHLAPDQAAAAVQAWALWAERGRRGTGPDAVEAAVPVARRMVELAGADRAAAYAMELERRYWQRRNRAAALQHARQDRLGLGWGNHDHHTFRSSRAAFRPLAEVFAELGFAPRERFHAGAEAGWGAQVLEHPGCGAVVFADVDLAPEEVGVRFSEAPLEPSAALDTALGTVGLWCALHGESILGAGMHHLAGRFRFDALRRDLEAAGVAHMPAFSDLPHLRQAFTDAERWPVDGARLARLAAAGRLDEQTARDLAVRGAAGSHLENLARRAGYKGFNQGNVSVTIRATDPRTYRPASRS